MSTPPTPDLPALRAAARADLSDIPGSEPVRWRVVSMDYYGGIAPVCTATSYDPLLSAPHPTHRLPDGGPDPDGLYDCCPAPHIQVWSDRLAAYLAALLNTDADRDAAVRSAALTEAAGAVDALIPALQREWPDEPANSPWCCGVKDAATELRRLATAPTTTTEH